MQRVPDFQQHALPVVSPLAIPETQFFDVLRGQKLFPNLIMLLLFRPPVLRTTGEPLLMIILRSPDDNHALSG